MSFINVFSLPIHTPHKVFDNWCTSTQRKHCKTSDNFYKPLVDKGIYSRTHNTTEGNKTRLKAGQMIPGDEDEAGGGPQLHKDDPVHGAEGGGVTVLHAHTQRLYGLLQRKKSVNEKTTFSSNINCCKPNKSRGYLKSRSHCWHIKNLCRISTECWRIKNLCRTFYRVLAH